VELTTPKGRVFGRISDDGDFFVTAPPFDMGVRARWDRQPRLAPGRDGTSWMIWAFNLAPTVVVQFDRQGGVLREFRPSPGDPVPQQILASPTQDAILLMESSGWWAMNRVRMLRRAMTKTQGKDGRAVADWEVVFERTFQPCRQFGVVGGKLVANAGNAPQPDSIEFPLVENALSAVRQKLRLKAVAAKPGSALISPDGLELVGISSSGDWNRFVLMGDGHNATLHQGDGVVVEEFVIRNLDHIAKFDAGAFLLAPSKE
jgi:hypothetical protein